MNFINAMKIKKILFLLLLVHAIFLKAQGYSVSKFQKINEVNGGFTGMLDIDDSWGISIDNIGDLDGNGVNDIAVGAFGDDDGGSSRGAVWILFLDADNQVISHTKISNTSGGFTGVLDNDDRFGGAVSYLGDINNDGLIELAVGADYDGDGGFWHGAVWILSLNNDGTVNSHRKISDTQGNFLGFINGDAIFGTDIENIGDLDGDGIQDLAVGSRRDGDGGSRRGAVWILFMNADLTVKGFQKISSTQGNFSGTLQFEDFFGGSVANIGDLDGDGVTDIAVGAYRDDDLSINSGSFYILFLNTDGTVKNHTKISNLSGGLSNTISADALFGESIDGVTDIDNDGKIEIIVGALRERNNVSSTQTGGFYIIELNRDGTVSEDFLYTYGENCFTGNLEDGDFFGGSVSVLNNTSGNISFAVGAYRDRENGGRKGAIWILELGDKKEYKSSFENTSLCGLNDGSFTISELLANTNYSISYSLNSVVTTIQQQSNSQGEIEIIGLSAGKYENIEISQIGFTCISTLDPIEIHNADFIAEYNKTDPTSCGTADGVIEISKLTPNETYVVDYYFNSVLVRNNYTANSAGEVLLTGLSSGRYERIMIIGTTTPCSDGLGLMELTTTELNATVTSSNESFCGLNDGQIEIANLTPNTFYVINYSFNTNNITVEEQSNSQGEIELIGLSSGNYESIEVNQRGASCSKMLGNVEIEQANFQIEFEKTDPTSCAVSDGTISISRLLSNTLYNISYVKDGVRVNNNYSSNSVGEITLSALESGRYQNIQITDIANSCTDEIVVVDLNTISFSPSVYATNSSSCKVNDGSIVFSNLSANQFFEVSFEFEGNNENLRIQSDNFGELLISSLKSGIYENVFIRDVDTGCNTTLPDLNIICVPDEIECFKTKTFFTPNNDGYNDSWSLEMLNSCDYIVYIYDRFGKELARLTPSSPSWNGMYNGKRLPSNDYWYLVEYTNNLGETKYFRSHFALRRI